MAYTGGAQDGYGYEVFRRDNWTCQYCGFKGHDAITFRFMSVDHVVRQADGGGDELSNLRAACRACNDYHNRDSFGSFKEKHAALQASLSEDKAFFEERVRPFIR